MEKDWLAAETSEGVPHGQEVHRGSSVGSHERAEGRAKKGCLMKRQNAQRDGLMHRRRLPCRGEDGPESRSLKNFEGGRLNPLFLSRNHRGGIQEERRRLAKPDQDELNDAPGSSGDERLKRKRRRYRGKKKNKSWEGDQAGSGSGLGTDSRGRTELERGICVLIADRALPAGEIESTRTVGLYLKEKGGRRFMRANLERFLSCRASPRKRRSIERSQGHSRKVKRRHTSRTKLPSF